MGKLFINSNNILDSSQSEKWTIMRALDPRFGPQKHKPGHQFDGHIVRIVGFDPFEDAGSLPGTLRHNMCDRDVRHGMADFKHSVPQDITHLRGCQKKSNFPRYLPVRSKKGLWHYDPGYIIPSCRVALGESL